MSRGELQLCRLPSKSLLLNEIHGFQGSIHDNDQTGVANYGRQLYNHLFGGLQTGFKRSSKWIISADDSIDTVPLAALVVEVNKAGPVYLAQRKTILLLPGARFLEVTIGG